MCDEPFHSSKLQGASQDSVCSVVSDTTDLLALREEWTELLVHSKLPNIFLSWEWMAAWRQTQVRRGTPCVFLVRDGRSGELTGLAPLYNVGPRGPFHLRTITFMGTGVGADHLAFVCRSGLEGRVYESIIKHVLSMRAWDVLELPRMEEDHSTYAVDAIGKCGDGTYDCTVSVADLCPYVPLPATWEDYLRLIGRNARKNVGRRWRRLQEQGEAAFRCVESASELQQSWKVLLHLHQMRRHAVGDASAFLTPRSKAFHERFLQMALERGWLRLYLLLVDARCVAMQYCLSFGGRTAVLQGGFDVNWSQYGVGMVLIAHAIQAAIEEGASEVDFLRGAELYKAQQWAAVPRRDVSLVAWRRNPRVNLGMTVRGWSRTIKRHAQGRLAASGDAERSVGEERI